LRFWDASAIVPLLAHQSTTAFASRLWRDDPSVVVWWVTPIECVSALGRLLRERAIEPAAFATAMRRLSAFAGVWAEVEPSGTLREIAIRLLRLYPLRAADALQLAAAVTYRDQSGAAIPVVSFDSRLVAAAQAENLPTIGEEGHR
jgi:predicted nucleic acid-binding protein